MLKTPCSLKVMPLIKAEAVNNGQPEKHQYDHGSFFLENSSCDLTANKSDVDLLTDDEEHLLPIRQNPIFRSDIEKRHANQSLHRSEKSVTLSSNIALSANATNNASSRQTEIEHNRQASEKTDRVQKVVVTSNNQFSDDDCEVAYGQGFVLKLLKRFHSLSVKQNGSQLQSSASSSCLLDNVVLAGQSRSYGTTNLISSCSVDNIVNLAANDSGHHASSIWTRSVLHQPIAIMESNSCMPESDFSDQPASSENCCSDRDELPKPNIVKTVRTMFENISQNHNHNCTFLHAPQLGKYSKSVSQHLVMASERNSSSVLSEVREKTCAPDNDGYNQPSVMVYSGEKKFSWHTKPSHASNSPSTLDTHMHKSSPPVLMTTALDDSKVTLKELPARKGLHLDFAEVPSVKKFDKARLLPPALLSDHPLICEGQIDPGIPTYLSDNYIPVTDVDDLVDSGFSDSLDYSVESSLKEGDPSVIANSNTGLNYEFEGAGIVVDRSLLRKSRSNKQGIKFNESAIQTHEYPSEQSLLDAVEMDWSNRNYDDVVDNDYCGNSMSSIQLSRDPHDVQADSSFGSQNSSRFMPTNEISSAEVDSVTLRPVESDNATWSQSTTLDLLF